MEIKEVEAKARETIKKYDLSNTIVEYFPDLLCEDYFERIAMMHSVTLTKHAYSNYADWTEPDYFIFELRSKSKNTYGLSRVIALIFGVLDCCDEACHIEVWDEDKKYVRIKCDGHYHS